MKKIIKKEIHLVDRIPTRNELFSEFVEFYAGMLKRPSGRKFINEYLEESEYCHILFFHKNTLWHTGDSGSRRDCRAMYSIADFTNEINRIAKFNELFYDPRDKIYFIEVLVSDDEIRIAPTTKI